VKVAELFATFDIRPDRKSIADMNRTFRTMRGAAMGLGAFFGGGALFKGLIGFNEQVESAKNGIAGMLALARNTSVSAELKTASGLYDEIRMKAAELPGTTMEYVEAMQRLTQPILSAGGSLEDLKKMTVATIVAAKAGVGGATAKTAITDVLQGIGGRFSTTDFFLQAVLGRKFEGEEGRKKYRGMSKKERFKELLRELENPVFKELADKQANSFRGQLDKMKEALAQFLGRIGLPLFKALSSAMQKANKWLSENKATVEKLADAIGGALASAFGFLGSVLKFLAENGELAKTMLKGLMFVIGLLIGQWIKNWILFAGPWLRIWAIVSALIFVFETLRGKIGTVGALIITAFGAALIFKFNLVALAIGRMATAMFGFAGATRTAAAAASALQWQQLAGGSVMPGVAGAQAFAGNGAKNAASKAGNALKGIPYIGTGIAVSELMDHVIPEGAVGSIAKHLASGAIALPKLAAGMAWDAVNGEKGKLNSLSAPGTINAPLTINIHGVENAEQMTQRINEEQQKMMRHLQYSQGGGVR
jgi:hypothetical protein